MKDNKSEIFENRYKKNIIIKDVLNALGNKDIFFLNEHINNTFEPDTFDNHHLILLKTLSKIFIKLRFNSFCKEINLTYHNFGLRQKSNKIVLFWPSFI